MIEVLSIKSTTLPLADEEEQRNSVDDTEKKSELSRVTSKTFKTKRSSESDEIQILRNRLFARLSSYGDVCIGLVDMLICGILLKDLVELELEKFSLIHQSFQVIFIMLLVALAAWSVAEFYFAWRLWTGTQKRVPHRKALESSVHWRFSNGGILVLEVANGICYCSMGSPPLTGSLEIPLFSTLLLRVACVIFVHQFIEELSSFLEALESMRRRSIGIEVHLSESDEKNGLMPSGGRDKLGEQQIMMNNAVK